MTSTRNRTRGEKLTAPAARTLAEKTLLGTLLWSKESEFRMTDWAGENRLTIEARRNEQVLHVRVPRGDAHSLSSTEEPNVSSTFFAATEQIRERRVKLAALARQAAGETAKPAGYDPDGSATLVSALVAGTVNRTTQWARFDQEHGGTVFTAKAGDCPLRLDAAPHRRYLTVQEEDGKVLAIIAGREAGHRTGRDIWEPGHSLEDLQGAIEDVQIASTDRFLARHRAKTKRGDRDGEETPEETAMLSVMKALH